ncbi:hypothetical protein GCM10023310_26290 [Paenibacillus vulneris]|uniref:PmoA family protein n=1 Tax=Paenibacillus vulneris TaxID=1133364 RepID=A0ABW3UTM9_9BACL
MNNLEKNRWISLTIREDAPIPAVVRAELDEAVFITLSDWAGDDHLFAIDEASGAEYPCQLSRAGMASTPTGAVPEPALYILLRERPAGGDSSLLLVKRARKEAVPVDRRQNPWADIPGVFLDIQEENARVIFSIEGHLVTRYMYSRDVAKPYLYPLVGPHGKSLIQDGPDDHLHHHGIWWGHDDVNGHKLYHEFRGEGRQVHRKFLTLESGPVFGHLTALIDWQDENGNLLLQETRSIRVYNLPRESRYLDLATQLHAINGDVTFGSTKEGGFPFIRVNEQINAHHTGRLTAANGAVGEANIFGTVTEWVDYSGKLFLRMNPADGKDAKEFAEAGIAVFSAPDNETFAKQWFVRDYGPFTPANFHFNGGYDLRSGGTVGMRHRLYVHAGDVESGAVGERYAEYISPAVAVVRDAPNPSFPV